VTELIFDRFVISILIGMVGGFASVFVKFRNIKIEDIRRQGLIYGRQRCIEEIVSLIRGEEIESGIGVDVERAYRLAVQAANRKERKIDE